MAVTQISQIQVRRGALQDLGQLGSGEFGWAIDRFRLFIGNGTLEEGAPIEGRTEVLTQYTDLFALLAKYRFHGAQGGYEVLTGIDSLSYTYRVFQDKLDDVINIRDFGAMGNGRADDLPAIQRAVDEIYGRLSPVTPIITRRVINFHPGAYKIIGELRIPPYCVFRGASKDSVIIKQHDPAATCVFRTTDNTSTYGPAIVNNGAEIAHAILMDGITFTANTNQTIARIDSTQDIAFNRCQFIGTETNPDLATTVNSCVVISADYFSTEAIYFTECDFAGLTNAVTVTDTSTTTTSSIVFDKCTFSSVLNGITVTTSHTTDVTAGVKVSNSIFAMVGQQAITASVKVQGITSAFNTFKDVGNSYLGAGNAITPILEFNSGNNYSIADLFDRSQADNLIYPSVQHHGYSVVSTNAKDAVKLGNAYQTIGKTVIVAASSTNYIPMITTYRHGTINYSAERGNKYRTGSIKFSTNPGNSTCQYYDSYVEDTDVGIVLNVEFNASVPSIVCVADNSNDPTAFTFDIKSLVNN